MGVTTAALPMTPSRPEHLSEFLYDGIVRYTGPFSTRWLMANYGRNRFYLLNIHTVITDLGCSVNSLQESFKQAQEKIVDDPLIGPEFKILLSGGRISHTQLDNKHRSASKLLAHAVVCVMSLEIWARTHKPSYNVYHNMRIFPVHYSIENLTKNHLQDLLTYHERIPLADKKSIFTHPKINWVRDTSFRSLCAIYNGHMTKERLIDDLAGGSTAPKANCDAIRSFINDHYPPELHVGEVLEAGEEALMGQGVRDAAASFTVNRVIPINHGTMPVV